MIQFPKFVLNIDLAKNRYSRVFPKYTDLFFNWTSICHYRAIGTHSTNTVNPMRHFPSNLFFHAASKILSSNIDRFGQKAIPPYFTIIELFLLKQHRNTHNLNTSMELNGRRRHERAAMELQKICRRATEDPPWSRRKEQLSHCGASTESPWISSKATEKPPRSCHTAIE